MKFDRKREDVGNIVHLEHVNLTQPDQRLATLFYVAGLGGTRDPYLMVGADNMWVNLGRSQMHLPTSKPQLLRGTIGLVVPDLDLLIPSDRFDDAVRLAVDELGGTQSVVELRPGFDREFGKDATVQVGRVELDLHRTFVTGPFGLTIPLGDLFAESTPLVIGGRAFAALGPTGMLLHACYNAALGDYPVRLCSLRDLMLLAERPGADLQLVQQCARRWRGSAVVQRASTLAVETFDLPRSHPLWPLAGLQVPRGERWALHSYLTPSRSYLRPLASLMVIRGLRTKARYATALVRPSSAYLHSRGWTERSHIRRAVRRLRGADHD